jgi:signal peptidase II
MRDLIYLIIYLAGIAADRLSKIAVSHFMELYQSVPLIPGVFHLTYTVNTGAAFSILSGHRWFFVAVTFIALILIFYCALRVSPRYKILKLSVYLLASGASGNLIDRLISGGVVDFFDFRIWPIFNIADCLVVIAAVLLLWRAVFHSKETEDIFPARKKAGESGNGK